MTEWISVKDRLPEDRQKVLVNFVWLSNPQRTREMQYFKIDDFGRPNMFIAPDGGHHLLANLTHWMPLPNPPQN